MKKILITRISIKHSGIVQRKLKFLKSQICIDENNNAVYLSIDVSLMQASRDG